MKRSSLSTVAFIALLISCLSSCGGGTSVSGGGGGGGTSGKTEILYAQDYGVKLYAFRISANGGALTQTAAATIPASTYSSPSIAIAPSGNVLYASTGTTGIYEYSTDATGALSMVSGSPFLSQTATGISHLTIAPNGKFLYASDFSSSGVAGFSVGTNGALTNIPGAPFTALPSVMEGEIAVDPTGRFLYASASDDPFSSTGRNILGFTIDSQTGALTLMPGSPFPTLENGQPYGIQVDPSGKFLYVALSNSNGIAAFTIDPTTGALTTVPGSPFQTSSAQFTQTYELTIAPSGKFLYAFNFNGNTVTAFTINPTSGVLTTVAGSPFAINPHAEGGLVVDPSGRYLYMTIGFGGPTAFDIFDIDPNTGALTPNANSPVAGTQQPMSLAVAQFAQAH